MSVYSGASKRRRTLMPPDERRRQLLEAATRVFASKGYRSASISDIIAEAGVARGTFYLYLKSKEQVFLAIVKGFSDHVRGALADAAPSPELPDAGGPPGVPPCELPPSLGFFAADRRLTAVMLEEASAMNPRFDEEISPICATWRTPASSGPYSASPKPWLRAAFGVTGFRRTPAARRVRGTAERVRYSGSRRQSRRTCQTARGF